MNLVKKHLNIFITGKVQRIGFRFYAMQTAYRFNIAGFVRNEIDKTIYIEAEGKDDQLNMFVKWCTNGPPGSIIKDVKIEDGELQNFTDFEIK